MADCADSFKIVFGVLAAACVVFLVVKFQVAGVRAIPHLVMPAAASASVVVTPQDGTSYRVRDIPVVRGCLPVRLKDVCTNRQVGATGILCGNWPAEFRAKLPHTARPFLSVTGHIPCSVQVTHRLRSAFHELGQTPT